jgi:AbrB family looped-hinge helix DNA binding protein
MPIVSSKRQITLPLAGCKELDIKPGDEVEIIRYGNQFNIIKKTKGSAAGLLKDLKANDSVTNEESLRNHF